MRKTIIAAMATFLICHSGIADAVTAKPSAKPVAKPTSHATKKPGLLPTVVKPVAKPVAKSTTKSTAKTVSKKPTTVSKSTPAKKHYVRRVYKRKYVKPIPLPPAIWPPVNFIGQQGVYINYKVSASALANAISLVSTDSALYKDSQVCKEQSCGVVQLGSETGCDWWEIDSTLYGLVDSSTANTMIRGTLQTFAPSTAAKKVTTNYLVSPVPLTSGDRVVPTRALCWSKSSGAQMPAKIPDNIYVAYPSK
jgi:hypothetical protein